MKFLTNLSGAYWLLMKRLNASRVLKPLTNLIDQETYRNPHIQRILMFAAFVTLAALIINPSSRMPSLSYKIGDFSTTDIKANRDYLITDKVSTNELREEAAGKIPAVYDLDVNAQEKLFDRIDSAFGHMRNVVTDTEQGDKLDSVLDQSRPEFFDLIGTQLPDETFLELKRQQFKPQIDTAVKRLLDGLYNRYIVVSYSVIVPEIKKNGIVIINNQTKSEVLLRESDDIIELADAKRIIENKSYTLRSSFPGRVVSLARDVSISLVRPNVTFNFVETDRRRNLAAEGVKPVTLSIKKGEMIIREGAKVLKYHLMIFEGIMDLRRTTISSWPTSGYSCLSASLFTLRICLPPGTSRNSVCPIKTSSSWVSWLSCSALLPVFSSLYRDRWQTPSRSFPTHPISTPYRS